MDFDSSENFVAYFSIITLPTGIFRAHLALQQTRGDVMANQLYSVCGLVLSLHLLLLTQGLPAWWFTRQNGGENLKLSNTVI